MAVDRSLMQAPQGLSSLSPDAEQEIMIVLTDENGESPETLAEEEGESADFNENLIDKLDERTVQMLSSELLADYEADVSSRKEWLDTYVKGLKLLGMKIEERTDPWDGACGVNHPLLMESAVKFQAETISEVFPAAGPVMAKIVGKETPEKVASAQRVQADMNYQLTDVMREYRPEHERLLLSLCLSGNAFKKVYFDPSLDRQTATFIPAEDIVVPYGAANIETADRITHRMRKTKNELRKLQVAGFYDDVDLGEPLITMDDVEKQKATDQGFSATVTDKRFQILEMHVNLDLEGYEDKDDKGKPTGIHLPYVVTIEKGRGVILAIRRNWLEDDKLKARRQHFVHYGYIPGFGFYYFGLIHLIGGHTQAATSLLRQLIDAGTLANLPGGLKAKGLRIKNDDTPIGPGEWRDIDLPSGAIRDNILPLPYKEPSQTLSMLMDKVVDDGRRFAAVSDLQVSDMSAQAPVGTTLAILERVLKVMSAVQARIHYAMKQEFKLLAEIIRDHTPEDYDYEPETGEASAKREDYDCCEVIPVSDPNASTMAQRVVQYQAVLQLSQGAPQIYDLPYLHRQMIENLGVKNATKIIPDNDDMKPTDPVSENMAVLMGKPVKAFIYQDHEAHLAVHMAAIQDPKMMAVIGQNPQAQAIMGAAMSHVMEHVAFQYRREIEKQLGASLPPPPDFLGDDDEVGYLPPEIEAQLSTLAAQAATKLLQKDQQEAQAQQAQQAMQDPLIQMQQKDLEIKQAEQQRKAQKDQADQQLAQAELQRKQKKDLLDAAAKADQIRVSQAGVMSTSQQNQDRTQLDQTRMTLDAAAKADQQQHQNRQLMVNAANMADQNRFKEQSAQHEHIKHAVNLASEHAKHGAQIGLDRFKHNTQLSAQQKQHEDKLKAQAALAKQAAKNKPAPSGGSKK